MSERPINSPTVNLSEIATEDLVNEIYKRFDAIIMSLCKADENGNLSASHYYHGSMHLMVAECGFLKDELLEKHRENLKKFRQEIPHPGGAPS